MRGSQYRPEHLRWGIFRGSIAVEDGHLTPTQLRSGAWRRLRRDVYVDSRLELDHSLACHAAALILPERICFSGRSAAYLYGVKHAAAYGDDVHVTVSPASRISPHLGVKVHVTQLDERDHEMIDDLPVTSVSRTAWDLGAFLPLKAAMPIIDTLLAQKLVTPEELAGYAEEKKGRRGCRRAAHAFAISDGGAQSPPESELRVAAIEAGLPWPVTQHPVQVSGGLVLHPDLAWPEYRVAQEYDGLWHGEPDQFHLDRERLNLLAGAGWLVLHVTSKRLYKDLPGVIQELRTALHGRGWRG
jgi:hypothetical protein